MKDFSVLLQFAVREKKKNSTCVCLVRVWGVGSLSSPTQPIVEVLSNYALRCFPNVSHGSYTKRFRGKFAVSANGHRWLKCFMRTGKVKGQHVGSVWWRQACFVLDQSLANLVPLNLIPTPTTTELRITGVWSHRWVITGRSSHKTKRPRKHTVPWIIAVNSSVWSLWERFYPLRPNFSPTIEPVWMHHGVVWTSSTLSSVRGMQTRHQSLPARQRGIKKKNKIK